MKQLVAAGDHERITAVINFLTNDFAYSPQTNHRKVHQLWRFFFFGLSLENFMIAELVERLLFFWVGWVDRTCCCDCWVGDGSCSAS